MKNHHSRNAKALTSVAAAFAAALTLAPAAGASTGDYSGPPDSVPPTVPTGVTVSEATDGTLLVDWEASVDDGSGVRSYLVYVDGAYRTWTYDTAVRVDAEPNSSIQLRSTDYANNRSAKTDGYSLGGSDTVDPTVPTDLRTETLSDGRYRVTWTPSEDAGGVRSYLIYNKGVYQTWSPTAEVILDVPFGGRWDVQVRAVDTSGNRSEKSDVLVVGATPQDVTPPTAPTNLELTSVRVFENSESWQISWTPATDDSPLFRYEIFVNGTFRGSFSAGVGGAATSQYVRVSNEELAGGTVVVGLKAVDVHGNIGPAGLLEVDVP